MSIAIICESCGALIGQNVEANGSKAGYGDKGFDFCDNCMDKVEEFFVKKMKVGETVKLKKRFEVSKVLGEAAKAAYLDRIMPPPTVEMLEDAKEDSIVVE